MEETKSIAERLEALEQEKELKKLEAEKKENKFSFNWKDSFGMILGKKKRKDNYIIVQMINTNKEINFEKRQIINGVIKFNGKPYSIQPWEIVMYRGKPMVILPEWSITPLNIDKDYGDAVEAGRLNLGYEAIANELELNKIKEKKGWGMGGVIFLLVVLAVGGYYVFKGGI